MKCKENGELRGTGEVMWEIRENTGTRRAKKLKLIWEKGLVGGKMGGNYERSWREKRAEIH